MAVPAEQVLSLAILLAESPGGGVDLPAPDRIAIAPLLVALVTAVLTLLVRRWPRIQTGTSLLGSAGYAVAVFALFAEVRAGGPIAYELSAWPAPFGITAVADGLSTLMLALAAVVSLGALAFSAVYVGEFGQRLTYHTLYHFMLVGVSGAFLTGDVFNLFVWFEVMLMASYVLVVFYSGPEQTRAALTYVVLNLVGGALMLLAIGGLYATTGTLNMADLARRLADPGAYGIAVEPVLGISVLLFAVFALKAGIVPFHFWVPPAYRAAPAPIAAVLAGVVKKVGIYAILRLYFTVFAGMTFAEPLPLVGGQSTLAFYGPVMLVMAAASVFLGGIAAVDRADLDGLLAYSSVSQIGFVVLPLAVGATVPAVRELAVAAAIVYALHHGIAKALLFLTSGAIYGAVGTTRLPQLGGLTERAPVLSGAFFVGGLALVGVPPLFGFFGKLFVFDALSRAEAVPALAVALGGAALTIAYFTRAWNRGFWGEPGEAVGLPDPDRTQVAVVVGFAVLVALLGIGVDPVIEAVRAASTAAVDGDAYVEVVDPLGPGEAGVPGEGGEG